MNSGARGRATVAITFLGAGAIAATPIVSPAGARPHPLARVQLTSGETVALEMSGSGVPILPPSTVENVHSVYIDPNFPGTIPQALGAPQQLYPITGTHNGFFDPSVASGVTILDDAIKQQLADGNNVVVYGHSQGATIETLEMEKLAASPNPPSSDQLAFVLTGDPDLPNGGMLERFDYPGLPSNLTLPSLGVTFYGATPNDTPYPTVMYEGEYDGFADFPRYPLDLLADFNALFGIPFVHSIEPDFPKSLVDQAFVWQTSPDYHGDTTYYMIPTENLPLLDLLRGNPVGNAIADLLQPDLKVLVNLGYGPDNLPYSQYPDVPTPASGLLPAVNPVTLLQNLAAGAKQGVQDFLADLKDPSSASTAGTIDHTATAIVPMDLDASNIVTELQNLLTANSNALATLIAAPLDTFMPVVDTGSAIFTALPTETVNLVLAGFKQLAGGDLQAAFGNFTDPIGGSVGLLSIASFLILSDIQDAAGRISSAVQTAASDDVSFIEGLPGLFS